MNENPDMHNFTNPIFSFVLGPSTTLYGPVLDWLRILLWTGVGVGVGTGIGRENGMGVGTLFGQEVGFALGNGRISIRRN
jgi:hypothetical protein